jgi:hypothetical protein
VLFINAHPAALALAGYTCMMDGTSPNIFFISANAASDGVRSSDLAALEAKIIPHTAAMIKMAMAKDCFLCLVMLIVFPHYFPKKDYL